MLTNPRSALDPKIGVIRRSVQSQLIRKNLNFQPIREQQQTTNVRSANQRQLPYRSKLVRKIEDQSRPNFVGLVSYCRLECPKKRKTKNESNSRLRMHQLVLFAYILSSRTRAIIVRQVHATYRRKSICRPQTAIGPTIQRESKSTEN